MIDRNMNDQRDEEIKMEGESEVADTPTADALDGGEGVPFDGAENGGGEEGLQPQDQDMSPMPQQQPPIPQQQEPGMELNSDPQQEADMAAAAAEKMFTQSQVNDIVGRVRQEGRDSAMKDLYGRYGVNDENELNDIFGRGQAYEGLNDEYLNQGNQIKEVMAENALLKSHVDESRWEDIKLILGGKGLDISQENIESMIPSHPEWRQQSPAANPQALAAMDVIPKEFTPEMGEQLANSPAPQQQQAQQPAVATLRKLGNEAKPVDGLGAGMETEEDRARRLYGF